MTPAKENPMQSGEQALADSPGLEGYEPARKAGSSGFKWLVGAISPKATEAEKLRLELYCMNERRKAQVEQTRHYREQIEALERTLKFCYTLLAPRSNANAIIAANPERAQEAHRAIYERRPRDEPYDVMMTRLDSALKEPPHAE